VAEVPVVCLRPLVIYPASGEEGATNEAEVCRVQCDLRIQNVRVAYNIIAVQAFCTGLEPRLADCSAIPTNGGRGSVKTYKTSRYESEALRIWPQRCITAKLARFNNSFSQVQCNSCKTRKCGSGCSFYRTLFL
jgi:hypothetical protein